MSRTKSFKLLKSRGKTLQFITNNLNFTYKPGYETLDNLTYRVIALFCFVYRTNFSLIDKSVLAISHFWYCW